MPEAPDKSLESWIWDADELDRFPKGAGEEYRTLVEIVEELDALEQEAKSTDASLRGILDKLGIGA